MPNNFLQNAFAIAAPAHTYSEPERYTIEEQGEEMAFYCEPNYYEVLVH